MGKKLKPIDREKLESSLAELKELEGRVEKVIESIEEQLNPEENQSLLSRLLLWLMIFGGFYFLYALATGEFISG